MGNDELQAKILRLEQECEKLKEYIKDLQTRKDRYYLQVLEYERQVNDWIKWKDKVVKLFESACRCKYLNEETDICSYTNEKCININKCVYKYQELSSNYHSALEEIREIVKPYLTDCQGSLCEPIDEVLNKINEVL